MVLSELLVSVLSFGLSLKFDGPAVCARVSIGLDLGYDEFYYSWCVTLAPPSVPSSFRPISKEVKSGVPWYADG